MTQSQHKQNQTETVTNKTDDAGTEHHGKSGKGAALCQREDEVHAPSNQALDEGNLHRICGRQLACQIIVDAPGETGTGDRQGAPTQAERPSFPDQDNKTAPARMANAPSNKRRSTFSRKT